MPAMQRPIENRRTGFTLLEVILAAALSLVLMLALYAALRLHLTMAQRGSEQVAKAQTARAALERIALDVRAIVPPAPVKGSASSASNATGPSSSTSSGSSSTEPASSASGTETESVSHRTAFGMMGGSDWIELCVAVLAPNLDDAELAAVEGSVAQASNLLRVRYSLTPLNNLPDSKTGTLRLGLARSQVSAVHAERLDLSSDAS